MRILAFSDIHDSFESFPVENLPEADVCLIAGDLTNYGEHGKWTLPSADLRAAANRLGLRLNLSQWQGEEITRARVWLQQVAERYPIFWIAGNHDFGLVNAT